MGEVLAQEKGRRADTGRRVGGGGGWDGGPAAGSSRRV